MSSFSVTVERLTILPHAGADALELCEVGAYRAVVRRGEYQTGDLAVYIPEQAVLPDGLVEELGLTGRLAGSAKNRVKAVRLRGELSQGLVCRPGAIDAERLVAAFDAREDLASELGITKWVPAVPIHFGGEVSAHAQFLPWIDIENLKRFPTVFSDGELVEATEKVHGSAGCFTWTVEDGLLVSSKGLGSQYLTLVEAPDNLYWRCAREFALAEHCAQLAVTHGADRVAIYGEVYGSAVQDLGYGVARDTLGFACFDARVGLADGSTRWLERDEIAAQFGGLHVVPVLYRGPYDYATLLALSDGVETVSGTGSHTREGLVIRAIPERRSDVLGGRAIAKLVGGDYLTRKGGTEFE